MLRTIRFVLALAFIASAPLAYADPPARAGRINYAAGAVSFAPAEAPDQWIGAVLNRPLTSGDRLWADSDGRAEFHVGSTAVRMASQTSLDVLNLNDDTLQFRLAQGVANVRVRNLDPGDTVEIATPSGAVVIRQPGSYRVSFDPRSDTSRVAVNFGQAEVVTPAQSFNVPSGQVAVLPLGGSIAFEVAGFGSTDEFDRWSAERDRRNDNVTSTRYVSPQMTGYEDLDQYGTWRTLPEYGAVWTPTRVAAGWAPYRHGHWVWVSPWGWTWVDDAPWGFAPFHYGRWVNVHGHWAWAPGAIVRRPVYAPALVAFVGGPRWSVSVSSGPAVGWFPLGWREPYIPSYRASPTYVRNVNVTHVTNVTNITNINYVNRNNPQAVTVVPQNAFVSARPVAQSTVSVPQAELARAQVIREQSPAQPVRASFAAERAGQRPPATAAAREVVAVSAPAAPAARFAPQAQERGAGAGRSDDVEPRVRVIGRERAEARRAERGTQQEPQPERPNAAAPARASAPPASSPTTVRATPTAPAQAVTAPPAAPSRVAAPPSAPSAVAAPAGAAPRPAPVPRTAEENRPREPRNAATPESASRPPVERERPQARRDPPARAEAQADRADNARERRMQRPEQPAPQREVPRSAVPAQQPQAAREVPRPATQAPQPIVVREVPRPQPQAARETPRPATPPPQAARETPRPAAQAQQVQGPRAQAPQAANQQDERVRPDRRRGRDS